MKIDTLGLAFAIQLFTYRDTLNGTLTFCESVEFIYIYICTSELINKKYSCLLVRKLCYMKINNLQNVNQNSSIDKLAILL